MDVVGQPLVAHWVRLQYSEEKRRRSRKMRIASST